MRRQAFTIATLTLCAQAALAASPDLNVQLNLLEAKVNGKSQPNVSLAERVSALERTVHGQVRSGSLIKRVKDLADVTGGSTRQNFDPPQLPKLDSALDVERNPAPRAVSAPKTSSPPAVRKHPGTGTISGSKHPGTLAKQTPRTAPRPTLDPVLKARVEQDIRLGMQHHNAGNIALAVQVFQNVLVTDPGNSNAHFNLGVIYEETGDLTSALHNYRGALLQTPNDPEVLEAIASLERRTGGATQAAAPQNSTPSIPAPAPDFRAQPIAAPVSSPYAPSGYANQLYAQDGQPAALPFVEPAYSAPPSYQAGPFHASNPGTPLLQGNAQQADLSSGADQTSAALAHASGIQPNGVPLRATGAGAARQAHPIRRRILHTAAVTGLSAVTGVNTGSGLGNALFAGARRGLGCPLCSWISRF